MMEIASAAPSTGSVPAPSSSSSTSELSPAAFRMADNVGHVRREGGQALFDALFIADVGQHFVKHRQAAAVRSRNHQAAHHHQGEQTHCLEQ